MSGLWREAAIAALLCGGLGACATPHYPIDAADARGPAPLTMARPQYPIDDGRPTPGEAREAAVAAQTTDTASAATAETAPEPPPMSAPVGRVESQPLPPPGPSAEAAGARLQYAALTTEAATSAPAPAPTATTPVAAAPSAAPPPSPAPAPVSAAPSADQSPPSTDAALTPRQVIHDQAPAGAPPSIASRYAQPAPSASRQYATLPPPAPNASGLFIAGEVVNATGDVYENYEVQRGDHIDELARNFSTSRDALLSANHIGSPYVIRPGQIIKVPVAKAYVARTGDTLVGVARRFSVSPSELAQLNHVDMRSSLRAGQQLGLPSSMRDRGPQPMETQYARGGYTPSHGYVTQVPSYPALTPDAGYHAPRPIPPPEAALGLSDAQITAAARGRFAWPVRGDIVKRFGPLGVGQRNDGVDIKAAQGTDVRAAAPGEVVYAGNQVPGFGNLVLIKHADGWVTAYAHLDSVSVQMRQQVSQGQTLGSVGMSGGLTEPELHFEVRYAPTPADKARPVDPSLVLPAA